MKLFSKNRSLLVDMLLSLTGFCLVLFIMAHLFMDASILLGPDAFNEMALLLEKFYFAQVGTPLVIVGLLTHITVALLKQRHKLDSFSQAFRHIHYPETALWLVQLFSGLLLIFFALLHVAVIVLARVTEINIISTSVRIADIKFQIFYHILMTLTMIHLACGVYRLYAKWIGHGRRRFVPVVVLIFVLYWGVSTMALQRYIAYAPELKKLHDYIHRYKDDRENKALREKILNISHEQNITLNKTLLKKIKIQDETILHSLILDQ
ncbi:MAG: hypothetical protein PF637_06320 [Spirochaetes bacterium]|jgi:fumarate reductase subunit C|nr:hypothetical protein [Spirochaetota bacterium]